MSEWMTEENYGWMIRGEGNVVKMKVKVCFGSIFFDIFVRF